VHRSHRSALLRKDPDHYRPLFGDQPADLPYVWPQSDRDPGCDGHRKQADGSPGLEWRPR
jgi:hypothetical protein